MVFVFPAIAAAYGGLVLFIYNLISSRLGWPELSLPWWPKKLGEPPAMIISWYMIGAWVGAFIGVIALVWFYPRR
jgi:hypothetical protein